MLCRKCKTELPEDAAFCYKCGRKQASSRKYERDDGRKQIVMDLGIRPDGTRRRKYFYGATIAEANAKKDEFAAKLNGGIQIERLEITLYEWYQEWKQLYKPSTKVAYNTLKQYDHTFNTHLKSIQDRRMVDIVHADLQSIINEAEGRSSSGIDKLRMLINQLFQKAIKNHIIHENVAEGLEYPEASDEGSRPHRALERWEIDLITNNYHKHRAGIWVMLMLYAGLRRGEMIGLAWSDIDFKQNVIHVRRAAHFEANQTVNGKTKTKAGVRDIPMPPVLVKALKAAQLAAAPTGKQDKELNYICRSADDKQLTQAGFGRGFDGFCLVMEAGANGDPMVQQQGRRKKLPNEVKQLRKEGKLEEANRRLLEIRAEEAINRIRFDISSHDLRHTYATFLYDAGVDVKTAQRYLGHSNVLMTMQLYTHLSEEKERASKALLLDFLGTQKQ